MTELEDNEASDKEEDIQIIEPVARVNHNSVQPRHRFAWQNEDIAENNQYLSVHQSHVQSMHSPSHDEEESKK